MEVFFTSQSISDLVSVSGAYAGLFNVSTPFVNTYYTFFDLKWVVFIFRSLWGELDILNLGCPTSPNALVAGL